MLFRLNTMLLLFTGKFNIMYKLSLGDWSGEGTPGNIPNPVVKLTSADGTWGVAPRESRSLPRDFLLLKQTFFKHPDYPIPPGLIQTLFLLSSIILSVRL